MEKRIRTYEWTVPQTDLALVAQMAGLDYLRAMARGELPGPPIGETLGIEPPREADFTEGRVVMRLRPQAFQYNPIGSVHGGVYATLLDSVVGCAVHSMLPAGVTYTTLELKVNYVRPLLVGGPEVEAIGEVIQITRQTGLAQGRIVDAAGKLYAHCTTTCLLKRPEA